MRRDRDERRPTILYLVTSDVSSVFLRGQLAHLIEHGFRVVVGTRFEHGDPADRLDLGVDTIDLPFVRQPTPLGDLRALWATFRAIRRLRPDVVNSSTPKAGLLGTLAATAARVPVRVYVVRGLRFETATGRGRRALIALERLTARLATHVVFNSASSRAVAEAEGVLRPGRGRVLGGGSGNGIDISRFAVLPSRRSARATLGLPNVAETDPRDTVIGFVGRLTKDKGIGDLVEVFSELTTRASRLRLLVVGSFEGGDALDDATRRIIDEHPRIHHLGWTDDVATIYRAIDVLAFPSYREGLPNAPLEAQLCGTPVVGYAATGTVDAVRHGVTGLLAPVGDREALTAALATLVDDPERAGELGAAGREWVAASFRREVIWAALLELYRSALAAR